MTKETLKPGTPTPNSGIYEQVSPNGRRTREQVTSTERHPLPPTPKPGMGYREVQPAQHNGGRKK